MSFHSIPVQCLQAGDPYYCFCQKTARRLATALELAPDGWTLTFQSRRSEEHTSELQSLMRISYAAFRLKKKNHLQPQLARNLCHRRRTLNRLGLNYTNE